ncbi:MAG: YeiH family protein [Paraclostridium sp.]
MQIASKEKQTSKVKAIIPGLLVSIIVAIISMFLGKFVPQLGAATVAIFLGMIVGNLFLNQEIFSAGYKFSETELLSYSIVLLGATLSITTIMELGLSGIIFIVLQMTITIVGAMYIGKKLGFSDNFRFLMASGNAVCGSSAIAATAPVIDADDKEKGIAITIVNVTGVVLMLLLPLLTNMLYNQELIKTSAMIGGTLQSVGQVVASGAMVNEATKDLAMLFKIVRVILLVCVVFIFGHMKNKSNEEIINKEETAIEKKKVSVPWYVIGFFITCALFSLNLITPELSHLCKEASSKLEIVALAAIGLRVNFRELIKQGKSVSLYGLFVGILQVIAAMVLIGILL